VRKLLAERERRELLSRVTEVHDELLKSLVHLEKENVQLEERLGQSAPMGLSEYRILIVDDEPLVAAVLKELFLEHGLRSEVVGSAADAIARVDAGGMHLVFCDKNLPDRSGLDVLRHVKEHHADVEVIMMTGYGSLESAIQALDMGAAGYVLKPFDDLQELLTKMKEVRRKQEFRVKAASFLERFKRKNHVFIDKYEHLRRRLLELQATTS
jgi:DNA-binding NtrC family response regulator